MAKPAMRAGNKLPSAAFEGSAKDMASDRKMAAKPKKTPARDGLAKYAKTKRFIGA